MFGYARIIGHGDGEYGYADLNELESTKIDVFNPASTGSSNWTVKTAAIHRDTDFEDLPAEQRYAHQHLDKYRGQVLDQLDREDRDVVNGKVAELRAAETRYKATVDGPRGHRVSTVVELNETRRQLSALAAQYGLGFDPAGEGTFTVAAVPIED
ncbi:hypothetical protein [Pseudoclavibacter sp. VKM Ac-2867]|uniref:hypothetical protein n=1 Tax=Pseudoclavibacter sp. VKM Ac-2867 TaxID=2783829 RepID=UPI00188DBDED|nr:hypothetical protein [Pseudoclavibacter sp. VKM Ac-2867]MBF4459379.1 hypothetical protein [Pseudoclavibacter sp. VKM Ac-2867]